MTGEEISAKTLILMSHPEEFGEGRSYKRCDGIKYMESKLIWIECLDRSENFVGLLDTPESQQSERL